MAVGYALAPWLNEFGSDWTIPHASNTCLIYTEGPMTGKLHVDGNLQAWTHYTGRPGRPNPAQDQTCAEQGATITKLQTLIEPLKELEL